MTASEHEYRVIPSERSERQEGKILEALAFLQGESTITLPSLVSAQIGQLPQGSSAILITPMAWSELLLAVDSLQRHKLRPVVVLLMARSFGGRQSNEDLVQSLAERNVPVCPIYCDADLSAGQYTGTCRQRPGVGQPCTEVFSYCNALQAYCAEDSEQCVAREERAAIADLLPR